MRMASNVKRMEIQQFAEILKNSDKFKQYQIIDVREPDELAIANMGPDITNLPLQASSQWTEQIKLGKLLDSTKPTLVLCHHGRRSMMMAEFLTEHADFTDVYNIEGGIDQYSADIDATIPRY